MSFVHKVRDWNGVFRIVRSRSQFHPAHRLVCHTPRQNLRTTIPHIYRPHYPSVLVSLVSSKWRHWRRVKTATVAHRSVQIMMASHWLQLLRWSESLLLRIYETILEVQVLKLARLDLLRSMYGSQIVSMRLHRWQECSSIYFRTDLACASIIHTSTTVDLVPWK